MNRLYKIALAAVTFCALTFAQIQGLADSFNFNGQSLGEFQGLSNSGPVPSYFVNFANNTNTIDPSLAYTRAGTATYYNPVGTLSYASANVPRFDYDPATLIEIGLLHERTTLQNVENSTIVGGTTWSTNNVSGVTTNNAISTDGTMNATTMTSTGSSGGVIGSTVLTTSTTTWVTTSGAFKWISGPTTLQLTVMTQGAFGGTGGDRYIQFNGQTGALLANSSEVTNIYIQPLKNGWFRVMGTVLPTAITANPNMAFYAAQSGTNFAAFEPQMEANRWATSYIPNSSTSTSATRTGDKLVNTSATFLNPNQGTFITSGMFEAPLSSGPQMYIATLSNGGSTSNEVVDFANTNDKVQGLITSGGSQQFSQGVLFQLQAYTPWLAGISYGGGNNYEGGNGLPGATGTAFNTGAGPTALTQINLGTNEGGSLTNGLSGWISSFAYYNRKVTPNQLQAMTLYAQNYFTITDWDDAAVAKCQALQPGATTCRNTLITHTIPAGCGGPITISAAGTYSGCWYSPTSGVPAVTIATSGIVNLLNCTAIGTGNGNGIQGEINGSITNCDGWNTSSSKPAYWADLDVASGGTLLMNNNRYSNVWGVRIAGHSQTSSAMLQFLTNIGYNMQGGLTSNPTNHPLQVKNGIFPGEQIQGNVYMNEPNASSTEDVINQYQAPCTTGSHCTISGNLIVGAYSNPLSASASYSGGGIIADGFTTDSASMATQFLDITGNIVLQTSNYGVAISAGHDNTITSNLVLSDGYALGSAFAQPSGDVGMYITNIYGQAGTTFFNDTANNNIVMWYRAASNSFNNFSFACGGTCAGNNPPSINNSAYTAIYQERLAILNNLGNF